MITIQILWLETGDTALSASHCTPALRKSVRAVTKLARFWSDIRWFPRLCLRYTLFHENKGAGKTAPTSPSDDSTAGGISARGGWRPVFNFYAGTSASLYCRACNFKNVSALLAGKFYTCYIEPNGLPLLMDIGATRFYSKDIHLVVMIQTNTSHRCVPL